ncbi:MAG: M28 family peptidase [Planctomycetes bacterium]|nr:M28 family peptidase [Planctomycetota bacterium]
MLKRHKRYILALVTIIVIPILLSAEPSLIASQDSINSDRLKGHISFLSDDLLGGRGVGSIGSSIAQLYIANQMQGSGLEPGFSESSYYQKFDMIEINTKPEMKLIISGKRRESGLKYYDEFIAFPGVQREHIKIEKAELVFAGYGIAAPEYDWDDYKDVDVKGKVLLIMNNDPNTGDPDFFGGKARLYYGRWDYKYDQAARMGAIGAIIIHTAPSAGYRWKVVQTSWSGAQFELPQSERSSLVYKSWVTEKAAYKIVKMGGNNLDELRLAAEDRRFRPVPLGVTVSCSLESTYRKIKATNIGGVIEGSDPELKEEAVVFTAHYDHLGIGKAVDGDSIYNGARDNATGIACILTLAQAFSQMDNPPRRTLVFLAVDAEESGLLGSQYYAENPTFPAGKIAANINIDTVNIWGKTRDVSIVGSNKSTIDAEVKEAAKTQGRIVLPYPRPEQGSFYRADQFSFAKIGVPCLYLSGGQDFIGREKGWGQKQGTSWNDTHYHQPSDEYNPDWDLSGCIEDLHLIFEVARQLANKEQMPRWLPGDEFEAVRLKAIDKAK